MNHTKLRELAKERLKDAKALLGRKRWSAAYYLAGYVIECGLKACVLRALLDSEFIFGEKDGYKRLSECWTHDLDKLIGIAGLKEKLKLAIQADVQFDTNWAVVKGWSEVSRYGTKTEQEARELFEAITDPDHGVLKWIRSHW